MGYTGKSAPLRGLLTVEALENAKKNNEQLVDISEEN